MANATDRVYTQLPMVFGIILGLLGLLLSGCVSKTLTQNIYVSGSNATRITSSDVQEKPVDVGRGLSATVPIGGL